MPLRQDDIARRRDRLGEIGEALLRTQRDDHFAIGIEIDADKYRLEGIPAESGFFPLRLQIQDALGATGIIDGEIFVRPAK